MIIHSYLTNGESMYNFCLLFLESYKYHNGEDTKIVLSTRDLNKKQISKIKGIYKNVDIINENFNYDYLAKVTGYNKDYLEKIKKDVEKGKNITGKKDHIIMKQYISVEDRYRTSILDVISKYNPSYMLHLDIDICFKENIDPMIKIIKNNDISFKLRDTKEKNRLIVGYALGFTINQRSINFINKWMDYIDKFPLKKKPKGYGQISLWNAYNEMKKCTKIGEFPIWMTASSNNYNDWNPILLSGNKGNKNWNIKHFRKIYKNEE